MHEFRQAIEAGDLDAAIALLDDDVVFRSPIAHKPYTGKPVVGVILRTVATIFEDFVYEREIGAAGSPDMLWSSPRPSTACRSRVATSCISTTPD